MVYCPDSNESTPEMIIDVSLGCFHSTHDRASAAVEKVEIGLSGLRKDELEQLLQDLEAGQRLANAERCSVAEDVPSYREEIDQVEAEITKRF